MLINASTVGRRTFRERAVSSQQVGHVVALTDAIQILAMYADLKIPKFEVGKRHTASTGYRQVQPVQSARGDGGRNY
jgi:hypothetical protein